MRTDPDSGRAGRKRTWLAALIPVALLAATPCAVAVAHQARIAEAMFVGAVAVTLLLSGAIGVTTVVALATYHRGAALQRQVATAAAALSALAGTALTLHVVSLIDAPEPADIGWFGLAGTPAWFWLAGVPVAVLVGTAAWIGSRPGAPPVATEAPPVGVPVLRLAQRQTALFVATTWVRSILSMGILLIAAGLASTLVDLTDGDVPVPGLLITAFGLWNLAQAHARLLIDERGITFVTSGVVRSSIPYQHVERADALESAPRTALFPPSGSDRGWGASTGRGPALGLRLTDGRAFVFSTGEAHTAAGLVNGYLHRQRDHADHA